MDFSSYKLIRLSADYEIPLFDCGDSDLNDFLINDSKNYLEKLLAVTYLLVSGDKTAAFFCVANDKISVQDSDSKSQWKKLSKVMPFHKRYESFPAVKIGRFAVDISMKGQGLGTALLDYIKEFFMTNNRTGCLFVTVDAYTESLEFYEKNGFKYLCPIREQEKNEKTRLMYYSLRELTN